MLKLARAQVPAAEFVHADVRELPADFGRFGAVTAFFSLLMLSRAEIDKTLLKIKGWLEPGGWFALSMVDMDTDSLPLEFLGVPVFVTGYPQDQLAAKLVEAGFQVDSIETVQFTPAGTPPESQIFALCRLPA
jgi:hypothetical protein